jgi:hypothetical protein
MVALVVAIAGLLLLGVLEQGPRLVRDMGMADVSPGLLEVDPEARGVVTLGGGVTAAMYASGLRLVHDGDVLTETVVRGSVVSAVLGSTEGRGEGRRERVRAHLDHVRIRDVLIRPGEARYVGEVHDGATSLPLSVEVRLTGPVVKVVLEVEGADALVVHLDHQPATLGIPPALPDRNLRRRAHWVGDGTGATAAFTTVLGTTVGVGPVGAARGVDLRERGRHDVHVWSDTAVLTVSSRASRP